MSEKRPLKVVAPEQNYNIQYYEDEIALTDVWLFLYRNWKIIVSIFLICLTVGIVAAVSRPTTYIYSASVTLEIGMVDIGIGRPVTIEPINTIRLKLEEIFIPSAIKKHKAKFGYDENITAKVTIPKGTNIIKIKMSGKNAGEERYISLMQVVIEMLINEQDQLISQMKKRLNSEKTVLSETRVLVPPETSVEKATGKRIMIVLLSVVLGVILSGGISLISESIKKAKIQIQENKS